jgi:hypothetical protein
MSSKKSEHTIANAMSDDEYLRQADENFDVWKPDVPEEDGRQVRPNYKPKETHRKKRNKAKGRANDILPVLSEDEDEQPYSPGGWI